MPDSSNAGAGATTAPAERLAPKQLQILRSAYKIMGLKGGIRFALQDVADDAGVSKALLLYHFKTKESLVLATLQWALDTVAARIRRAIDPIETAEAKVGVMLDTIFAQPELNRRFYLVYTDLIGQAARVEAFSAVAATFHDTVNDMYADIAAQGMREGAFFARDPHIAAAAMRALIDGMFIQWLLERDWQSSHVTYREMCKRAILAYLRAGESR